MKTLIKITALAVITAFAALSCAPDVELTGRDWGEYDSQHGAGLSNNLNNNSAVPGISGTLPLAPSGSTITPEQRELKLTFPANADFLKASNDELLGKMKEFLTIFKYTTPDATLPETYSKSVDGDKAEYEFVRRSNTGTSPSFTTEITIRVSQSFLLASQTTPDATGVIAKIDGAKYTVGGYGLDLDNDGNAGEAIYDDAYLNVPTGWGGSTNYVKAGVGGSGLNLNIAPNFGTSPFSAAAASRPVSIATLAGTGLGGTLASDPQNLRRKAILESLISKFKVQKFNIASGTWGDFAATITYQNDPAAAGTLGGMFGQLVIASFTPEDFGIYRVSATGMKDLKTSGQESFYGTELKISVQSANTNNGSPSKRLDSFVSDATAFTVETRMLVSDGDLNFRSKSLNYDNAGKKAVVELEFDQILFTPPSGSETRYYLKEDADMFKKNVRFVYRFGSNKSLGTTTTLYDTWSVTAAQMTTAGSGNTLQFSSQPASLTVGDRIRFGTTGNGVTITSIDPIDDSDPDNPTILYYEFSLSGSLIWGANEYVRKWSQGSNVETTDLIEPTDIAIIKITDVKFDKLYDTATPPVQNGTKVTLTIDEGIKASTGLNDVYLLIAPGFEYGHNLLTFGDFAAVDTVIDGVSGWKLYGKIQ
jgi:hypothetical protein